MTGHGVLNSSADELHYVVVRKTGHALESALATPVDTTDSLRGVSPHRSVCGRFRQDRGDPVIAAADLTRLTPTAFATAQRRWDTSGAPMKHVLRMLGHKTRQRR
jgi:hypothetical protein